MLKFIVKGSKYIFYDSDVIDFLIVSFQTIHDYQQSPIVRNNQTPILHPSCEEPRTRPIMIGDGPVSPVRLFVIASATFLKLDSSNA